MSTYKSLRKALSAQNRKLERELRAEFREDILAEVREEAGEELYKKSSGDILELAIEKLLRRKFATLPICETLEVAPEQVLLIQERLQAADQN